MGARGRRPRSPPPQTQAGKKISADARPSRHLSGRQDPLDRLSRLRALRSRNRNQSRSHPARALRSQYRRSQTDDAAAGDVTAPVSPTALRGMLDDGSELALIDVREELIFSQGHLLLARSAPLSRLELKFAALVPRRSTRIVLCDDNDGLVQRAAAVLARNGYSDLRILAGGVEAWAAAGFELFTGVNVPSKAFGEFIEHENRTPSIAADELARLIGEDGDFVVLDSRPFDEYARVSIPGATNVPGAELVLRARELAPSPDTTVVVNCAGRTRSIIGAQSLINAGLPNKVVALRNGTMGYTLAGFAPDSGKTQRAPRVSREQLAWAKSAARRVAQACGVKTIDRTTLDASRR